MTKAAIYADNYYALYPKDGGAIKFEKAQGESNGYKYREISGVVATPFCFVFAWSYYYESSCGISVLEIVKDGKSYERRFDKAFTQRGLVTKSKQFAAELHEEANG